MRNLDEVHQARQWLLGHSHATHPRWVIERALEYAEAIERAGLCLKSVEGEDLYKFLTSDDAQAARRATLVEATL